MAKNKKETTSLPTVLAFERCIETSDAVFFGMHGDVATPVIVTEKTVRGSQSNYGQSEKNAKASNIQRVNAAMLKADETVLKICYTLKAIGRVGKTCACNSPEFAAKLKSFINEKLTLENAKILAELYFANIVNGRTLWRNAMTGDNITTSVSMIKDGVVVETITSVASEDCQDMSLTDAAKVKFASMIEAVARAFMGEKKVMFNVESSIFMGRGSEVYPSQEFMQDRGDKDALSKKLYTVNGDQAAYHSQKVSNAIRVIDRTYPDFVDQPIAVEPYGSVTTQSMAYRWTETGKDFYTMFERAIAGEAMNDDDVRFVLAVLIRGGVFGGKDGKEDKPANEVTSEAQD